MADTPSPSAFRSPWSSALAITALVLGFGALAFTAGAIEGPPDSKQGRHFDARVELTESLAAAPTNSQQAAIASLRAKLPELAVTFDPATGVTRTINHPTDYLTGPSPEADVEALALGFARGHLDLLGLTAADLDEYDVSDSVYSRVSGATHLYLRQRHLGLPVYNAQLQVNVNRDGRLMSVNNSFLSDIANAVNATEPLLGAADAVAAAARHAEIPFSVAPTAAGAPEGVEQRTAVAQQGLSTEPVEARLMWLPIRRGEARLVWNFQLWTPDGNHIYDTNVDAVSGKVWTRIDWVANADYKVYPQPVESPNHTTPLPPADARVTLTDPFDVTASPFGWHDTDGVAGAEFTTHRGNNVHAWEDSDGNDSPPAPASEPDCGAGLNCSFPLDLSMAPSTYRPAAVSNLFYWNNVIHDVQYQYGFDEAGGNFQLNNYGNGGAANDSVQALAQSGQGTCNANFGTPPDGSRPRMRMFICGNASPSRDGDFDAAVIVHEYGHGISNRLVGGPGTTSCLGNSQQPGEGLSDWWGLVYTAEVGDVGTEARGLATYLFGQPPNGPGIRPQPYSTDPAVNNYTYSSIAGMSIPHGVGSVWAQAAWEVYWALIDVHGFSADIYDAAGGAGNQRMMLYVNEGLKNSICSPTFINVRDGIIQAVMDNYGGEDLCTVWDAFAAFGLGTDASTPGPSSTTATNGFDTPLECQCTVPDPASALTATANGDNQIDLSWTASPTMDVTYNVYRSFGGCPQTAPELIASGIMGTTYSDTTVSGGTTYSYAVTTVDITGDCESPATNCDDATATGVCTRPPTFDGVVSVTNNASSTCGLQVAWNAATGHCGSNVVYNVYRDTTSGFVPGAGNLVDSCLSSTSYADAAVSNGVEYFYVVRAEDDSGNGAGSCASGNEEANTVEDSAVPTGTITSFLMDDMESGSGNWTTAAGPANTDPNPWVIVTTDSQSPTHSYFVADPAVIKDQFLITAAAIVVPPASPADLSFWQRFETENSFDGGVLEYSVNGGTNWFDILAGNGAGIPANAGRFLANGYTGAISTSFMSPIAGRMAWEGSSSGWQQVMVDMADFSGSNLLLRWRFASDVSVASTGWWVDDVDFSFTNACTAGVPVFGDGFETGDTSEWTTFVSGDPK